MVGSLFEKLPALPLVKDPKHKGKSQPRIGHGARGNFYYYGEPLSEYDIALRRGRKKLYQFEVFGSLLFAVIFLILFGFGVYQAGIEILFDEAFWGPTNGGQTISLWLSLLFFSYLIYRGMRPLRKMEDVETKPYKDEAVSKTKKAKHIDVSLRFSVEARQALEQGYNLAMQHKHEVVTVELIFLAVLEDIRIQMMFARLGISVNRLKARVAHIFADGAATKAPVTDALFYQVVFHAYEQAYQARLQYVGTTELLMAAVGQSEALQELLYDVEIEKDTLDDMVEWLRIRERLHQQYRKFRAAAATRNKHGLDRAMTAVATPYLNNFSQDLTMAAVFGRLDTCVARDKELNDIFRVVESGRQSILLVGDHGVGKMTIIDGIVERMIEDAVPDRMKDRRLVQLSTSSLLAGTTVSGAQERLINMMNEITKARNIILFINNIQDLMGGTGDGAGLDVSETLADFISSGQILVLATTTPKGYNKHIMNSQLGNVMSRVDIPEMDEDQAMQVLQAKAGQFEYKHKVFFSYAAIKAASSLASRFMYDQPLPESAIELVSEAASYVRSTKGENKFVGKDDVAHVVGQKTGVPVTSITDDESSKLLKLEEAMHERVIGQHEAVVSVANALRRARAEIRSTKRPIANFLFLGSTGVGKTELAKTIADIYFGGENRMIRVDMSEYQDTSAVYRMIGQPGQQGTGLFTEAVRQQPFSLILLDEMEKANPSILDLFLQVFDDGRLTDSVGRVIDFTNSIIIATSNAGTSYIQEGMRAGKTVEEIQNDLLKNELKQHFRPEFLNRFDGIVVFQPLSREDVKAIAQLMLRRVEKDLEQKGMRFQVTDAGLEALAAAGYDPEFGARPMRRAIQNLVENKLAELLLSGKLQRRDVVIYDGDAGVRVEKGVRLR